MFKRAQRMKKLMPLSVLFSTRQIESPTSIADKVLDSLKTCPSTFYIFVQASGIRSQDFQQKSTAPTIHRFMAGEEKSIRSAASVNEVSGIINTQRLERALRQQCNVKPGYSVLGLRQSAPALPLNRLFKLDRMELIALDRRWCTSITGR